MAIRIAVEQPDQRARRRRGSGRTDRARAPMMPSRMVLANGRSRRVRRIAADCSGSSSASQSQALLGAVRRGDMVRPRTGRQCVDLTFASGSPRTVIANAKSEAAWEPDSSPSVRSSCRELPRKSRIRMPDLRLRPQFPQAGVTPPSVAHPAFEPQACRRRPPGRDRQRRDQPGMGVAQPELAAMQRRYRRRQAQSKPGARLGAAGLQPHKPFDRMSRDRLPEFPVHDR